MTTFDIDCLDYSIIADWYEGFKHAVSHSNPTKAQVDAYQNAISSWLNQ